MKPSEIARWVAILPGAIIGVIAANFILHWILVVTLNSETIQAPYERVERFLLPFVAAIAFVASGSMIAPSRKPVVAAILCALLAVAWGLYFFLRSS